MTKHQFVVIIVPCKVARPEDGRTYVEIKYLQPRTGVSYRQVVGSGTDWNSAVGDACMRLRRVRAADRRVRAAELRIDVTYEWDAA